MIPIGIQCSLFYERCQFPHALLKAYFPICLGGKMRGILQRLTINVEGRLCPCLGGI